MDVAVDDEIDGKKVRAIDYTAYIEMAEKKWDDIAAEVVDRSALRDLKVFHSLDSVGVGEVSLLVMAAAEHREAAIEGCKNAVEMIKKRLPVWGKELFEDDSYA